MSVSTRPWRQPPGWRTKRSYASSSPASELLDLNLLLHAVDEALDLVDGWLAQPATTVVHPTDRHAAVLRSLLAPLGTAGNLATDAHLAALSIEHGAELCSVDADFTRFPGVRWANPLRR